MSEERFLEVYQVARRLSFSDEFVRRCCRLQLLEAVRVGRRWRVGVDALERFLEARRQPPR